jgi:hypothetical protein
MIYLNAKNAADESQYSVDFTSHLPEGVTIQNATAIVSESGTESPISLEIYDVVVGGHASPPLENNVIFSLRGGVTDGGDPINYKLKFELEDTAQSPHGNYTRYAMVQVRDDL